MQHVSSVSAVVVPHFDEARPRRPVGLASGAADLRQVRRFLTAQLASAGWAVHDVSLARLWPGRDGQLSLELIVYVESPGGRQRLRLQGTWDGPAGGESVIRPACHGEWLLGVRCASPELGLTLCTPDLDDRLPRAREFLDERQKGDAVCSVLTAASGAAGDASRIMLRAYRHGRRAVFQIGTPAAAFLKLLRRPPSAALLRAYEDLRAWLAERSAGQVRMPAVLAADPEGRSVVSEAVRHDCRVRGTRLRDGEQVARTLASLHAAPVTLTTRHTPRDEVDTLARWSHALREADGPGGADDAGSGAFLTWVDVLVAAAGTLPDEGLRPVHRDFYGAQLLHTADALWIVDFDTLTLAHPEVDLATYAAHQMLDDLLAGTPLDQAAARCDALVAQYTRVGGYPDPTRLRFYLACAHARLWAIHRARGCDPAALAALQQHAAALVAAAGA